MGHKSHPLSPLLRRVLTTGASSTVTTTGGGNSGGGGGGGATGTWTTEESAVTALGATILEWMEADTGITQASGKCSAWAAKAGVKTYSQATGSRQMGVIAQDSSINYQQCLESTATSLATSQFYDRTSSTGSVANATTVLTGFALVKPADATTLFELCCSRDQDRTHVLLNPTGGKYAGVEVNDTVHTTHPVTSLTDTAASAWRIIGWSFDGVTTGNIVLYRNNTAQTTGTNIAWSSGFGFNRIGAGAYTSAGDPTPLSRYFAGRIACIIICSGLINSTQRQTIVDYLAKKYLVT